MKNVDNVVNTFTSANVCLKVNDSNIGFVQRLEICDVVDNQTFEKYTKIVLHRFVNDHEEIINNMRLDKFSFSMINSTAGAYSAYTSSDAEVIGFQMELDAVGTTMTTNILKQMITIKAKLFTFVDSEQIAKLAEKEKEDLNDLIAILKANQNKTTKESVPTATLPILKNTPAKSKKIKK